MKNGIRSRSRAEMLLAGVITARATSYLFSKLIMESMSMFNLLGIRFLFALTLLLILFFKRIRRIDRKSLLAGMIMGSMYFLVMTAELSGLKRTSSGNVSFLENTAIVIVPLLQAVLLHRFPRWKAVVCALLCLVGVGFLTIGNGLTFGRGSLRLYDPDDGSPDAWKH